MQGRDLGAYEIPAKHIYIALCPPHTHTPYPHSWHRAPKTFVIP